MDKFIKKMFYKQREDFEKSCADREKKYKIPEGVLVTTDIPYIDDGNKAHRLDIYRPQNRDKEILPVIVNIHGGGLLIGNKEFNRCFCAMAALQGFLVYSIEYSLVPDCNYFNQLHEVAVAMDFIKNRIETDKGDQNHIYGVADSGGANLLLYTVALQNNAVVSKAFKLKPSLLKLNAVGFISGMFYTTKFDKIGLFLPKYLYGKNYKKRSFAPLTNPEHKAIAGSLVPCYLVTSHNDHLQHYTINFVKALVKYNIPYKLDNYGKNPKLTHAFSVFEPFYKESTDTIISMTDFFRKY